MLRHACDRYGAYEACAEPSFSLERLPLVDRGFVYAIAHVRGGGELGRLWHEVSASVHLHGSSTPRFNLLFHRVKYCHYQPTGLLHELGCLFPFN